MLWRRPLGSEPAVRSERLPAPGARETERFPGFDVLQELPRWDAVTAGVVLRRLAPPPDLVFFDLREQAVAGALFDQLLDQHAEPRVPVLQLVDARLVAGQGDGWHHERLPPDPQAWHLTLRLLDDDAHATYDCGFAECDQDRQAVLLQRVQDRIAAGTRGDDGDWHDLPAKYVWSLWTRYAAAAFYSHPWAWNEIGFGGPAYPRGYKNTGLDRREPWEVADADPTDPREWGRQQEQERRRRTRLEGARGDLEAGDAGQPGEDGQTG